MENNLDDIFDPLEGKQKKPKSKRWILISLAFALLIAAIIVVSYFVFVKKEEPKGLEAVHTELERFETFAQNQSMESQKNDEFDKLIAEIKARHQDGSTPKPEQPAMQARQNPNTNNQMQQRQIKESQTKEVQNKETQEQMPQMQAKPMDFNPPKPAFNASQKQAKSSNQMPAPMKQNKQEKKVKTPNEMSASDAFNSLETPKGFYLQVGVFSNTPNTDFLNKLSSFAYRVEKLSRQGKIVNRYLVGPFKTRAEAEAKILDITQKVTKPVLVEIF